MDRDLTQLAGNDDAMSSAIVHACVARLRTLLDSGAEAVTLSREEALLIFGVLDGVAEHLDRLQPKR